MLDMQPMVNVNDQFCHVVLQTLSSLMVNTTVYVLE